MRSKECALSSCLTSTYYAKVAIIPQNMLTFASLIP